MSGYGFAYFRWRQFNWEDYPGYVCARRNCPWCAKFQRGFAKLQGRKL